VLQRPAQYANVLAEFVHFLLQSLDLSKQALQVIRTVVRVIVDTRLELPPVLEAAMI